MENVIPFSLGQATLPTLSFPLTEQAPEPPLRPKQPSLTCETGDNHCPIAHYLVSSSIIMRRGPNLLEIGRRFRLLANW
ncbi:MAG: hypothetical protein GDA43_02635 [Hormoscilla sp. SP5CHS1]|nr:hypothetical protein [Hormoscilla sp. SP12CHS1]MBC6452217.1 hypothetical protein [Hormoscilla sp. SP5CHS1]